MTKISLLVIACCISLSAFGQLSQGEGESIMLADKKFSCYLPKYFEIQEKPPGVIHRASGTFVIAVKIPTEQARKISASSQGLSRSFFEDPRYEITSFREETSPQRHRQHGQAERKYWMAYDLQGHSFERLTVVRTKGSEQYLIIGNYPVKLKDQVAEEVKKIVESFVIHQG